MNANVKQWLLARLSERSTWIGFAGLAGLWGYHINPDALANIVTTTLSVIGGTLILSGDK